MLNIEVNTGQTTQAFTSSFCIYFNIRYLTFDIRYFEFKKYPCCGTFLRRLHAAGGLGY
jgi:hypothetical protein